MKNTPNAVTIPGTISAHSDPTQPSLAITMNSGITPSCVGTARVATTNTSSGVRPRNASLAKAKPARVEKKTTDVATVPDTMRLLVSAFQNGTASIARWALSQKWPPGSSGGTRLVSTSRLCEPTRNDQ